MLKHPIADHPERRLEFERRAEALRDRLSDPLLRGQADRERAAMDAARVAALRTSRVLCSSHKPGPNELAQLRRQLEIELAHIELELAGDRAPVVVARPVR